MKQLRQAAAREQWAPVAWWFVLALAEEGALYAMVHRLSPHGALMMGVVLLAAWLAPLLAFLSLASPGRARELPPPPGEGTYEEWNRQGKLLGKVLLYFEDNPDLPPDLRRTLRAARADLRDTFGAHPLRDDLERVCQRVRTGAIHDMKDWFWQEYRGTTRELRQAFEEKAQDGEGQDRLTALQEAVEDAAARMVRRCMPRMLERERLTCARDCAWLASQALHGEGLRFSPIERAAALVVEWCDFSEPWQPSLVLRRAVERLEREAGSASLQDAAIPAGGGEGEAGASGAGAEQIVIRNGKKYRRVRVRKRHRRHSRHYRGPSLVDLLLSFGQWVRYSIRSWWLYR